MTEALRVEGSLPEQAAVSPDNRVRLEVGWEAYQALLAWRGENAIPRLTYQDGVVELMSPSLAHERISRMIGRLIEAWVEERGGELLSTGSWTLRDEEGCQGAEPDASYSFGGQVPERPDLVIEVEWSRGGIHKRPIYQAVGVPEVWIWRQGVLVAHSLGADGYKEVQASRVLPGIPLERVQVLALRMDQTAAVREFRAEIRDQGL